MRAKTSLSRNRENATATNPTIRFVPNNRAKLKPLAEPAMKTKAATERFIDTGCLVNRDKTKENRPVVIQVMKNQLLASGASTPNWVSTPTWTVSPTKM